MSDARKTRLVILLGAGIAAVAAGVVALVMFAGPTGPRAGQSTGATVKIELRGKPVASIRKDGHAIGKTPMTIIVPRGTTPITFDATFTITKYNLGRQKQKVETHQLTKTIIPDAEQSVDFRIEDAKLVEQQISQ